MRNSNTGRTYLKTDRASRELRRGGLVLLRLSNGAACLLQAAELASNDTVSYTHLTLPTIVSV